MIQAFKTAKDLMFTPTGIILTIGQASMITGIVVLTAAAWVKIVRPVWPFIISMFK